LTGTETSLHEGNFPQPNLPSLGQTYIFAKNAKIRAAYRYKRAADDAYRIGEEIVMRLAGSIQKLTEPERQCRTWMLIPSETPKESDLLLPFLPADPGLAVAAMLAESDDAEAAYEALTKRLVGELDGKVERNFAQEEVWAAARSALNSDMNGRQFEILETRGRKLEEIAKIDAPTFKNRFWDARV
jgi:hypothetical protein